MLDIIQRLLDIPDHDYTHVDQLNEAILRYTPIEEVIEQSHRKFLTSYLEQTKSDGTSRWNRWPRVHGLRLAMIPEKPDSTQWMSDDGRAEHSSRISSETETDAEEGHFCVIHVSEDTDGTNIVCELARHRPLYYTRGSLKTLATTQFDPLSLATHGSNQPTLCVYAISSSLLGRSLPVLSETHLTYLLDCMKKFRGYVGRSRAADTSSRYKIAPGSRMADCTSGDVIVYYPSTQ